MTFAYTTDEEDASITLSQLTCSDGECIEASVILTGCDLKKTPARRALAVDAISTRGGPIAVTSDRKGDHAILSVEEAIPFSKVSIRLVVRIDPDLKKFVSIEDFSGIRLGGSLDPKQKVIHLKHLSPAERNLPACGLKLIENAMEFAN